MASAQKAPRPIEGSFIVADIGSKFGNGREVPKGTYLREYDSLELAGIASIVEKVHMEVGVRVTPDEADEFVKDNLTMSVHAFAELVADRCNRLMMQKPQEKR